MLTTTAEALRTEIGLLSDGQYSAPIVSCYLNVDGRHRPRLDDCIAAFTALHHDAVTQAAADPATAPLVDADLITIADWLAHFDRGATRGLAVFVASHIGLLTIIELPVPVRDEIVVAARPHILQLEAIHSRITRTGIVVIDRTGVRLFMHTFGTFSEGPAYTRKEPPHRDHQHGWNVAGSNAATRGSSGKVLPTGNHIDRSEDERLHQHIAVCADAVEKYADRNGLTALLIAGTAHEGRMLQRTLGEHYRALVRGELAVRANAPAAEIFEAAGEAIARLEGAAQTLVVDELHDALGLGTAVCGLGPVLGALSTQRARALVMCEATTTFTGARCRSCDALMTGATVCPACGAATEPVADVVEAAVEHAVRDGVTIHILDAQHPLTEYGGIAAITHYAAVPA